MKETSSASAYVTETSSLPGTQDVFSIPAQQALENLPGPELPPTEEIGSDPVRSESSLIPWHETSAPQTRGI